MTHVVFEQHGTLDKYIGDAIMAIFGAPLMQEDHPYRACCTALDMTKNLEELQDSWRKQGKPILHIGIGINSGWMIVGNMGSERRFDYTVLGDNVNLASRLEGLTKIYGVPIIVSETTWESVKHHLVGRELDVVQVKGKQDPVSIFQILGRISDRAVFDAPLEIFRKGMENYRSRNWAEAQTLFKHVEDWWPGDPPSCLYQLRCRELLAKPPGKDWRFVTTDRRQIMYSGRLFESQ
jgi:adenylate cyclase